MKTALSAALVVFLLVTSAFAEPRTWTATNGKTTEAILIHFDGEKVYLLKSNGKYAVLPANQLSEADNQVLDAFAAEPVKHILGKVIKIADGDTITVLDRDKQSHKIRLEGIDSPEIGQAFPNRKPGPFLTVDIEYARPTSRLFSKIETPYVYVVKKTLRRLSK